MSVIRQAYQNHGFVFTPNFLNVTKLVKDSGLAYARLVEIIEYGLYGKMPLTGPWRGKDAAHWAALKEQMDMHYDEFRKNYLRTKLFNKSEKTYLEQIKSFYQGNIYYVARALDLSVDDVRCALEMLKGEL